MVKMLLIALVVPVLLAAVGWCEERDTRENPLRLIRHERATILMGEDIEVVVTPTYLQDTKWVNVTWTNVPQPSKDDWIGLWVLWNSSSIYPDKHAPIKFQFCSKSETHLTTGSGKFQFYMVNMRSPFQFGLLRGGFEKPVLVANSTTVRFANNHVPLQIHYALTKKSTELMMTFVTLANNSAEVKWGQVSGHLDNVRKANYSVYRESDMCDSPAKDYGFMRPDTINTVLIDGLTPGAKYYYQCGSADEAGAYSEEYVFYAPPSPGNDGTTRILAFGDLGHGQMDDSSEVLHSEPPSLITTKRMAEDTNDYNFVMHIGDIAYAEGFASTWEEFFDQLQPLMTRLPYMVNPGNHESDSKNSGSYYQGHDSGGECSVPYTKRFRMPRESDDKPWYSFEYGVVHVIMMSTEHDFRKSSPQWLDLVQFFEAVNRSRTPWIIFSGHRPMYVDSTSEVGEASDQEGAKLLREHVEPLLFKYKVDLALWGHHHSYQRTSPVYNSMRTTGATTHVVIGMAGQSLSQNLEKIRPSYFEVVDDQHYGYTRIFADALSLKMEFVRNLDGGVHDTLKLTK